MNLPIKKILSEQSKEILTDFFIYKKSSGKKFYARKYFEKLLTQKDKYENRLWDENTTIVNHLLFHKDFKLSNSSIKELNKLTQDWSSANESGENSIYVLWKEFEVNALLKIIDEFNINYELKNKNNLYFVNYFLEDKIIKQIINDSETGKNNFPEIRLNKYFTKYSILLEEFQNLYKETISHEIEKFHKIKQLLTEEKVKQFNNNKINIVLEDIINKVEKTLLYYSYENQFVEKSIKTKKLKI